jgi:predicted negative regulator of RcsB-dependent stress response
MPLLLGFFRVVPIWVWILILVLGWGGWQKWQATRATKAAVEATERVAAEVAARELEQRFAQAAREASNTYAKNTAAARRAADSARSERDRLLNAVASVSACPATSAASGVDGTADLRRVLGACTEALHRMAADADQDAQRLIALQNYVKTAK